jgi:DNA-binding CsgD family transcriptional regulator
MTSTSSFVQPVVDRFLKRFNLTKRETEAAVLLVQGMRPKEITEHMSCSEKTVYAHLARVCKKTGCRDHHEVLCAILAFACQPVVGIEPDRVALTDQ